MAILTELKDPRVRDVTVTYVEVTADLRTAKVHVSIMGDDTKQRLVLRGLQNSAGFLQAKLNDRVEMRYTPRLEFVLDMGVKKSIEIARILRQVLPAEETQPATDAAANSAAADRDAADLHASDDFDAAQADLDVEDADDLDAKLPAKKCNADSAQSHNADSENTAPHLADIDPSHRPRAAPTPGE